MNKKIFTLLVGAIMIFGSALTVNAQAVHPYTPKLGPGVNFRDILTADTVKRLYDDNDSFYYLLSVTGIANPNLNGTIVNTNWLTNFSKNSREWSLVLSIDDYDMSTTNPKRYLRLENLAKLDTSYAYTWTGGTASGYTDSHKFGALRHSLWCLTYAVNGVAGSNIIYDFKNMETGLPLAAPIYKDFKSRFATASDNHQVYKDSINLYGNNIVSGWHFSQTYKSNHDLQTGMPLYSYVNIDTVAVLVLDDDADYDTPYKPGSTISTLEEATTGGIRVTIKHVAVKDLIIDPITGSVNITGAKRVQNVLLFTLKKVNRFVMNVNDWNAVGRADISFNPNATAIVTNGSWKYVNPFTDNDITGALGLKAYEVNDSLYHYGYMQFEALGTGTNAPPTGMKYLYVDTAFANYGNNQYLAFGWGPRRDNTLLKATSSMGWGGSFVSAAGATFNGKRPVRSNYLLGGVYWRLDSIIWATIKMVAAEQTIPFVNLLGTNPNGAIYNSTTPASFPTGIPVTLTANDVADWNAIIAEAAGYGITIPGSISLTAGGGLHGVFNAGSATPDYDLGNWTFTTTGANMLYKFYPNFNATSDLSHTFYKAYIDLLAKYESDSVKFVWTYMKDSIMENQSKFRVVYDPTYDSTFINVYQTRVRYPDYKYGAQNAIWPNWWENSFGERTIDPVGPITTATKMLLRPSDLFTRTPYGGLSFTIPPAIGTQTIEQAAKQYYDLVAKNIQYSNDFYTLPSFTYPLGTTLIWHLEGHGYPGFSLTDGSRAVNPALNGAIHNFHSFMEFYPQSYYSNMDRVMISTADTCRLFDFTYSGGGVNYSGLSHVYGWSTTNPGGTLYYRDSLFYVDLQDLGTNNQIITLDQSYNKGKKLLDTRIKIKYSVKCEPPAPVDPNEIVTIDPDLYLIRNTDGQYLCVPIWSITDSIFWVTPEANEDPTKMPCYQWIVKPIDNSLAFSIQNREFSRVFIDYATLSSTKYPGSRFTIGSPYTHASFNNRNVIGKVTPNSTTGTYRKLEQNDSRYSASTFVTDIAREFPINTFSFIRLGNTVKGDHLIGYKYVDRDATIIDVYAFKFLHFLATGENTAYLSWRGYQNKKDTTLYAEGTSYYDKLYFMLQEMEEDMIDPSFLIQLTNANTASGKVNEIYRPVYDKYTKKDRIYTNNLTAGIFFERFGYNPSKTNDILYLVPMIRQAYRLFLQDYYRWHPTLKGHYVTVGQQDRYILADKAYAALPYKRGTGLIDGLFGIPHFYFRNTYFDVDGKKNNDDYFAIVQRIDTGRIKDSDYFNTTQYSWGTPLYGDIADYMENVYDTYVAKLLLQQIRDSREFSLALLDIQHSPEAKAKFVVRGDAFMNSNISAFQLERDDDPIYRRFRNNEPDPWYPRVDRPDTLEFHLMNQGDGGQRLYENSGNYKSPNQTDMFGEDGGRTYNRDDYGNDYFRDTLQNVISFLGDNNTYEYPNTNYAFYVDTAYINRGTGWIKPQYLIAVDPYNPVESGDCDPSTGDYDIPNGKYVIARYLFNTSQYAKEVKDSVQMGKKSDEWVETNKEYTLTGTTTKFRYFTSNNFNKVEPIKDAVMRNPNGKAYTKDGKWERLAFSWAIHAGDKLYVLKGLEPLVNNNTIDDPRDVFELLLKDYGLGTGKSRILNFTRLVNDNIVAGTAYTEAYFDGGDIGDASIRTYYQFRSMAAVKAANQHIGLQAIIDLSDNTHKDWVFSFRYIERHASDFVIESETTDRNTFYGAMIRPGYGGWVKVQNGVPVITRSDLKDNMGQAEGSVYNVSLANKPVGNEVLDAAGAGVQIVGGTGAVAILNAAGKKVVISNLLGQTIANTTLTSDNASIAAPAGVVVVVIEGESAAKVLVK